jgi:DNA-binding transcriptional ArsR family regulator
MDDLERLRATAHPLRLRILSLLTGAAMSAAEVARELDVTQANASYHLRLLERTDLVSVVERVRVRGGDAKRYRHQSSSEPFELQSEEELATPSDTASFQQYVSALTEELRRRALMQADGPRVSTDAELWLTPEDWSAAVTAIGEASARMHAVAKGPRSVGTIPVSMTAVLFGMSRE